MRAAVCAYLKEPAVRGLLKEASTACTGVFQQKGTIGSQFERLTTTNKKEHPPCRSAESSLVSHKSQHEALVPGRGARGPDSSEVGSSPFNLRPYLS